MNVFDIRNRLIGDYKEYINSFINIRDERIDRFVQSNLHSGALWPDPLIQLNPSFQPDATIEEFVATGTLHPECAKAFRAKRSQEDAGFTLRLHKHQAEAIQVALRGFNYVLTTGTGSGKSLSYIIPIVDYVLQKGAGGVGKGIQAIIVYPMNALANSQEGELRKFLQYGYPDGKGPVTFGKYTGQESEAEREEMRSKPPNILLTNYVMLELLLTRPIERRIIEAAQGLRFLVLDELHTYRGRQGADVALLVRRVRDRMSSTQMQTVGTSATLAGTGTFEEQQLEVAQVASGMFGAEVQPKHVIGETLTRATEERDFTDPASIAELAQRVSDPGLRPTNYAGFIRDPLSSWLESTFGIRTQEGGGRLVRNIPRSIAGDEGAAQVLHDLTNVDGSRCKEAIEEGLLLGTLYSADGEGSRAPFAFRLHQFISRGGAVYATIEAGDKRYITMSGQQFRPGDRNKVLLPLAFCRECGQEYYSVRKVINPQTSQVSYLPRNLSNQSDDEASEAGFLYSSQEKPWPMEREAILERVPTDWLEYVEGSVELLRLRREHLPQPVQVDAIGRQVGDAGSGMQTHYIGSPFRFCLNCGVSYDFQQSSDFSKLATLSSEGRSTATTILSLSAVRNLRADVDLDPKAKKLLSFTDNRQDASLQAGHFNDFVEIGLLRAALFLAANRAGEGLTHDTLTQKVFDALVLPVEQYASDPEVRFRKRQETDRALRGVLGYRLYRDLKRGWRVTSPNLEQAGLLEIGYLALDEVCEADDLWEKRHPMLVSATPQVRMRVAKTLLDYMRRELAIKVDYLDPYTQERIQHQSSQHLIDPWAIDEDEYGKMEYASVLYPRSRERNDYRGNVFLSPRGGFGQYLKRATTFGDVGIKFKSEEVRTLICDLLEALRYGGLLEIGAPATTEGQIPGYQVPASALLWKAGDGSRVFHDPIRVPSESAQGHRANPFFVKFYRQMALDLMGMEAHEHTAQVPYELREEREEKFRSGELPVLFCSPTMELGVDISELNVVNMRNVPPTPANYAQRSGRAGRSGQPALVFSYCTTGSPHDQYFFKHPDKMVAGTVTPPRVDVTNEDLVRAHVHSIWLAETSLSLGNSLKDILELSGDPPSLALHPEVQEKISNPQAARRAKVRAQKVLESLGPELLQADWYSSGWLDEVLAQAPLRLNQTCERWRNLYRAALKQIETQFRIIKDHSRSQGDKNEATRLFREAKVQLELLTEVRNVTQSDFYSYRYFASEGFLPGYSFPRLPISAFIPARRIKQKDEFLSRSRFLAISEFGPRSVLYHEGSRYVINKVILPVGDGEQEGELGTDGERGLTRDAKLCQECGYLHPMSENAGRDMCEQCGAQLPSPMRRLFRMQNVSTKRRDRINSDEEERTRLGFEIITAMRFAEQDGHLVKRVAELKQGDINLATLSYGGSATIWRINLGEVRRKNRNRHGFVLDMERGYWGNSEQEESDQSDPMSPRKELVIPYVEDTRNCLLFEPIGKVEESVLVSLMSALKNAIQVLYQLEDSELAAEILPSDKDPRIILFYESAEGGAGVLRRLIDDRSALAQVATEALSICHFNPETGEDLRRAPRDKEDCEAACYNCLMSYYNQRVHRLLDRQLIKDALLALAATRVEAAPAATPRAEHLTYLMRQAEGSSLEQKWLSYIDTQGLRLPNNAQSFIESCGSRPDFLYTGDYSAAVYIDGPVHDYTHISERDKTLTEAMEDRGYIIIRFRYDEDWNVIISKYPHIFGREK